MRVLEHRHSSRQVLDAGGGHDRRAKKVGGGGGGGTYALALRPLGVTTLFE